MATALSAAGTYLATITEHKIDVTRPKKDEAGETIGGLLPQWVVRFAITARYIDDPDLMAHFGITEPAYVDYSSYDEETMGFLVMFKDPEVFNDETALLNYEQIQLAVDWAGQDFGLLNDGSQVGKTVMIRVKESINPNNNKAGLKVEWIDRQDADPVRQLQKMDDDAVKSLTQKLKIGVKGKAKPALPSKPVAASPKPGPAASPKATVTPKPASNAASPAPTASPTPKAATAPAAAPAAAKATPKAKAAPPPPPAATDTIDSNGDTLPKACTRDRAWEILCDNKGDNEDGVVEGAWIAAVTEVSENNSNLDEEKFTEANWGKVLEICMRDLSLAL